MSRSSAKGGYRIILRTVGSASTVVELTSGDVPVAWSVLPDSNTPRMTCSTGRAEPYCVVVIGVGAHASEARLFRAHKGAFVQSKVVQADTPTIVARDLDGDGDLDLLLELNSYEPTYADGEVYFQTSLQQGNEFGPATGCTRAVHYGERLAEPTSPARGACPK